MISGFLANHIGNSRDDSFRDMVQSLTKGAGCEIIINNVKGNLKNVCVVDKSRLRK